MRRIYDIGFFIAIALACVGLDFYILHRDQGDQSFGLKDYIAQRKSDVQDMLKPPSLATSLPSDIAGWDVRPNGADQIVQGTAESHAEQASEIALVKAIAALEKASHPAGDMAGITLTKGETRLRVIAVLVAPQHAIAGIETASSPTPLGPDSALNALIQQNLAHIGNAPYSVVDGVAFTELPAAAVIDDTQLRMMRATLGTELSVTVVTKSTDDTAIRAALQSIDFLMLNKLLQNPVMGLAKGRTTDARLDPENAVAPNNAPAQAKVNAKDTAEDTVAPPFARAAKPKAAPAETAVFVAPPAQMAGSSGQPCVRRSGILVCPDG